LRRVLVLDRDAKADAFFHADVDALADAGADGH
jgi:hypothetical protein